MNKPIPPRLEEQDIADIKKSLGIREIVDDPNARTIPQWARVLGLTTWMARKHVLAAVENGTWEQVTIVGQLTAYRQKVQEDT